MIFETKITRMERRCSKKKNIKELFSNSGERIGKTYEYRTKDGIKNLVPNGEVDRQELIDSFALSQDINYMINKFLNGDTSVMNPSEGVYGDFTNFPTSYAELFDRVQICKNVFESMPADIKKEFDNSAESFWTQFGSERFDKIFNDFNNASSDNNIETVEESEVVDNA